MKKYLFIVILIMCVMRVAAADVNLTAAHTTAVNFLQSKARSHHLASVPASGVKLLHAEANSSLAEKAVYYIFLTDQNFVIVSGDDRIPQVLGWGDRPVDVNSMPDNMRCFLEIYKKQIEYLQAHPGLVIEKPMLGKRPNIPSVAPLITASWDQKEPYYNQCPVYNGDYCVTGCPATSLAMVFHHWKYPNGPTPPVEGYMNQASNYEFEIPALPSITFDWGNMLDIYKGVTYTTAQADAVAWLMRYIGQVEQLQYTPSGTGGYGVDILRAVKFFGYDLDMAELIFKSKKAVNYDDSLLIADDEWHAMLQNELREGRPVVYSSFFREWWRLSGHAYTVDGYDASDDTYHVNWGWSGSYDGYFVLNEFFGSLNMNFNVEQHMVMGIQPPPTSPTIKALRSMVYLDGVVGSATTGTFTVKGYQLSSNVTLTLNDNSGAFSIDATTVAANELDNGKVITVTYAPQTSGYHTATITLSSPGVADKTVMITGKAVLDTTLPFMLPADSSYINSTQFRADWSDETPDENVESYTLKVYTRPEVELIDYLSGDDYPSEDAFAIVLSEPWSGVSVSAGNNCFYFAELLWGAGFDGHISYTIPYGFDNQVFSVQITTATWSSGLCSGNMTVESEQTEPVTYELASGETHTWLVTASSGEKITLNSPDLGHCPYMSMLKIYAGDVTQSGGSEPANAVNRMIPGITDKFFKVTDLPALGTYVYRVKALYIDGTESDWSNRQTVTLFENNHIFEVGDVNHDGGVSILDATYLIDYLLGSANGICTICADVNNDSIISISDVTALIDKLLSSK